MKKPPLVSIILTLYEIKYEYLDKCINSILTQTYKNWELLFLDDSSKDDTVQKVLDLKAGDERIKVFSTIFKSGPAMHLNSALKDSRGRWVAFINCGDIWNPDKLEKQVRFMEVKGYGFSYTKFQMRSKNGVNHGTALGGKEIVTYSDKLKC